MGLIDKIVGFYEDIRELNSSNIQDFRGKMKSWLKMGMLAGRIFYIKDMWARDVAALTFASFMALIPFMAMMFVIARGFGYTAMLESWLSTTFEAQPVVAQTIVNFVHNYIENTQSNYCRAFKSFNAAENDTLLYCRVMRWADIPMLIINNIKLKTIFFITYSTLKVPSTSVICMRSKAFNISRFCFNVLVLSQLKKIRICCDSALPNSTLT